MTMRLKRTLLLSAALTAFLYKPSFSGEAAFQQFLKAAAPETVGASREALCVDAEQFQGVVRGSVVAKLAGGASRRYDLALKLMAVRRDDGAVVDRLAIYDVTALAQERDGGGGAWCFEAPIVKVLPIDLPGQTTFNFEGDDPGAPYLSLTVDGDGGVTVSADGSWEQRILTSRRALLEARAREVETSPELAVGSGKFLCLVQPGARISLALFPAYSDHGSAELLGDVYDGQRGLLPAPIGHLGETPYFLEYNRQTGRIEAHPGEAPQQQ